MKKIWHIVAVSDNHGRRECIPTILRMYPNADYFFHCGDSEMPRYELEGYACVQGNCDGSQDLPLRMKIKVGEHNILLTHGHRDMSYGDPDTLSDRAIQFGCDIVCFGHTHVYTDETVKGIRLLNPGSLRYNRDGSAPSYMLITIQGDKVSAKRMNYIDP